MWLRSVAIAVLLLGGAGCSWDREDASGGRPEVVASFYPLEYVAARVGGDAVVVEGLTPAGVEPHDLELSSGQIRDLVDAGLVVYLGHGFQPAVEDALEGVDDAHKLDALEAVELLRGAEDGESEDDPHVWLDPSLMTTIAQQVAERLTEIDPGRATLYEDNAAELSGELDDLDRDFEDGLRTCATREFVTSHAAFGYLAARYDLEQTSVAGIDPEAEPSAQRLAEVARFVEEHDIEVIFFEELAPPDLAEALARETGARTDVLSPLETRPEEGGYIDEMRKNLDRLRDALSCD